MILRTLLFSSMGYISYQFPLLYDFVSSLPTLLIAAAIIILGIYLVRGKKQPEDEIVEYKGDDVDE